jgi:hypothetical protein
MESRCWRDGAWDGNRDAAIDPKRDPPTVLVRVLFHALFVPAIILRIRSEIDESTFCCLR